MRGRENSYAALYDRRCVFRGHTPEAPAPELRASDADRERVAEVLRDALAEGRLDMEEFEERLETTFRARTYGELAPITRDLPVGQGAAPGSTW